MSGASLDPRARTFAGRILEQLDHAGLTTGDIDRLTQWLAWAHDTRWYDVRVAEDGRVILEAHALDWCSQRGDRVDHVYHGAGTTLGEAAAHTLANIVGADTTKDDNPCQ